MMESLRHRTQALPAGVATSTALHVGIAAYLLFWISHPAPLVSEPVHLENAIPVLIEQMRPQPPKPEPPKPKPKTPPKPIPTPETIETTSTQQAVETPAEKVEPPKEPQVEEPPPVASAPYTSFVLGVIQREKRYPREAQLAGDEGTAIVSFVINRYGTVLAFTLEKRTGSSSLDNEVKRLLRRIAKFPPVPDNEFPGKDRIKFEVPVGFSLKD